MKETSKNVIGEYQGGFRSGRLTNYQIFIVRQLLQKTWEFNKEMRILFIDFQKAYDSLHRKSLISTLVEFHFPHKLINMIKSSIMETHVKCTNATKPNKCIIEFISYEENYPIRTMTTDFPELKPKLNKSTNVEAWIGGLISVSIISLSGLVGGLFWPLLNDPNKKKIVMKLLLGLAAGSLSSSAVFQLLPEAFKIPEAFPDYNYTALIMWLSLWGLYNLETLAGIVFYNEEKKKISIDELSPSLQMAIGNTNELKQISHGHSHNFKSTNNKSINETSPLSTLALLVLFGDSLHNIIDGMSIGVAFSENVTAGISISIAIACEEFPHEIGDFAILIQSGMSFRRALSFNFVSACTAFIGLVIGICLGNMEYSGFVFSFAGGLFLFITLTHLAF
ncbi:zinc transporter ZIP10-like [Sipha flava]|uniref:Zinc transporter ZIP10-like n=1 Tax=Sipha flava TaxID=143950 RepID=A0A8B8GAT2_9HEMI|nr:zinc transporter ZIP10-like [Sipha flava]